MVPQNPIQPIGLPSRQRQAYRKRPLLMQFHLGGAHLVDRQAGLASSRRVQGEKAADRSR
jgi:hypothetical protein